MRLSEYTDYSLRVLMYCAGHTEGLVTIAELADYHGISRHHLMKVVTDLGHQGLLETVRGRGGGIRLRKDPARIRIGDVVRATETDFRLVECFDAAVDRCVLSPHCRLHGVFNAGLRAFLRTLDQSTLADLVAPAAGSRPSRQRGVPITMAAPPSRRQPATGRISR